MNTCTIYFYISNEVHILDLAGPLQVFYEAKHFGKPYEISFLSDESNKQFSSGLNVNKLTHFSKILPNKDDIIIIPGYTIDKNEHNSFFYKWLQTANKNGVTICSICTGVFALAKSKLLDNLDCTTHWNYTEILQKQFPKVKVQRNRLFIEANNIYTSAGISTGIDLALYLVEKKYGAEFTFKLAKELVIYMRRDSLDKQESIYIQYRQHISYQIHEIQEWIVQNLSNKMSNEILAEKANMSSRNLTRLFKLNAGITIKEYIEKLRIEKATQLLKEGEKITIVAQVCGFTNAHHLALLLKKHFNKKPKEFKILSQLLP